jgi:hypothetical protein
MVDGTVVMLAGSSIASTQITDFNSAVAIQIGNAVNNMALELDQARQVNAALQKQLADANAKIKELEAKEK